MRCRFHLPVVLSCFLSHFLGLGVVAPAAFGQEAEASPETIHIYLLIGQSNMAGRGRVTAEDKQPHPRVLTLTKSLQWEKAVDPLHFDKPAVVGVGVGRTFAQTMLETTPDDVTIGLVPAAVGGSPIDSWKPGGYHSQTKSHPYDDMLKRIRHAMKSGQLKGVLWHQGESDSKPPLAEQYEAKLHALIARLRKELDAPDLPFIAGQMGQFAERPWSDAKKQVDRAHRDLPDKVPHTAFVSSEGLKHKGDQVHFDSASYRELGRRYAKAMRKLQEAAAKR